MPNADEIAGADPALVERARAYLAANACSAVSAGLLQRIYAIDGGEPAEVGEETAAIVLYAMHKQNMVGPPDVSEVGSRASNYIHVEHALPQPQAGEIA